MELTSGNGKPVSEFIREISYREGLGGVLVEGTLRVARRIGKYSDQFAMHVKGVELPAYNPHRAKAHGLNLLTAIGGNHNYGYAPEEIF